MDNISEQKYMLVTSEAMPLPEHYWGHNGES